MEQGQHTSYLTKAGDTWDLISFKVYGSTKFINKLKEANYYLKKVVIFPPEVAIAIPIIKLTTKGSEPEWF
ncbi:tail protein X [uncultured Cetobacterium sp.]|uniref:tail protein X n=1 Tax=uncultured Cetobacterium sp. TaxID=527638 RepID=UPI002621A188|nr:tail protein X [uncultured Cetobacterium sp.]